MPTFQSSDSLLALSRFVLSSESLETTLERVCDLALQAITSADLIGITMIVEGCSRTAVSTDPLAPEIDRVQYETGKGPCVAAYEQKRPFFIASTSEDGPWPEFRRMAAEHGVASTMSLPLMVGDDAIASINIYSRTPAAFGMAEAEVAQPFVTQAAIVLANASAYSDARSLNENLGEAMKSRAVIEQAKGMLMAAQKCDEDSAFEMLVKASQRENIKLRQVAERIVANAIERACGAEPPRLLS